MERIGPGRKNRRGGSGMNLLVLRKAAAILAGALLLTGLMVCGNLEKAKTRG